MRRQEILQLRCLCLRLSLSRRPKEPEPREAPPKTPKVEKEDGPDTPTAEDPAKEIGRQAVKKMSKEVKRMKRGLANKNENEDRQ